MDLVDAVQHYWLSISGIALLGLWLARLHWKQDRDQKDNDARFLSQEQDLNAGLSAIRSEITADRQNVAKLENQLDGHQRSQTEFQLAVTNRLTAIETTLGGLVKDIKAAIHEAMKS